MAKKQGVKETNGKKSTPAAGAATEKKKPSPSSSSSSSSKSKTTSKATTKTTTKTATNESSGPSLWRNPAVMAVLAVCAIVFVMYPQPQMDFDTDLLPMAKNYLEKNKLGLYSKQHRGKRKKMTKNGTTFEEEAPLFGLTVAVTGATSGIGLEVSRVLAARGATVVAIGRSATKLESLQEEFADYTSRIQPVQMDLGNLDSVAAGAKEILKSNKKIDFLINNAGIHRGRKGLFKKSKTKQRFDMAFGVNYLSHFLLTEKLLPLLQKSPAPTVVQISSGMHWGVDGSDLLATFSPEDAESTASGDTMNPPTASVPGGNHGFVFARTHRQYGNSKLAQILHARALQRRVPVQGKRKKKNTNKGKSAKNKKNRPNSATITNRNLNFVSVCPAAVGTKIVGKGLQKELYSFFSFPVNGFGIHSILYAMFDDQRNVEAQQLTENEVESNEDPSSGWWDRGDYYVNTRLTAPNPLDYFPNFLYSVLPVRDVMLFGGFASVIGLERFFPEKGTRASSKVSYDIELQENLYEWSLEAVSNWL